MKQKKSVNKEYIWMLFISLAAVLLRYMQRDLQSADMRTYMVPMYQGLSKLDLRSALLAQAGEYSMLYQLIIYILTRFSGEAIYKYKLSSCFFDFLLAFSVYFFVKKSRIQVKLS